MVFSKQSSKLAGKRAVIASLCETGTTFKLRHSKYKMPNLHCVQLMTCFLNMCTLQVCQLDTHYAMADGIPGSSRGSGQQC